MRHDKMDGNPRTHSIAVEPLAEEQTIANDVAHIHGEDYVIQG